MRSSDTGPELLHFIRALQSPMPEANSKRVFVAIDTFDGHHAGSQFQFAFPFHIHGSHSGSSPYGSWSLDALFFPFIGLHPGAAVEIVQWKGDTEADRRRAQFFLL